MTDVEARLHRIVDRRSTDDVWDDLLAMHGALEDIAGRHVERGGSFGGYCAACGEHWPCTERQTLERWLGDEA